MANRRVLERLWRLRELEEEQSRMALEARVGERNRVAETLADATRGAARSRGEFVARVSDADTAARTGALLEMEQGRRRQEMLRPQLRSVEKEVEAAREELLARRTGRRQVETLLERERRTEHEETARRAQQMLDDWYGRRTPQAPTMADRRVSAADGDSISAHKARGQPAGRSTFVNSD